MGQRSYISMMCGAVISLSSNLFRMARLKDAIVQQVVALAIKTTRT